MLRTVKGHKGQLGMPQAVEAFQGQELKRCTALGEQKPSALSWVLQDKQEQVSMCIGVGADRENYSD